MNQTELKSIETAMRQTQSKQLFTRYPVSVGVWFVTVSISRASCVGESFLGQPDFGRGIVNYYVFGLRENLISLLPKGEWETCYYV